MCVEREKGEGEKEREGVKNEERGERVRETGENEREIYFRELTTQLWRAGKSKVCRIDWQPGDPEKSCSKNPEVFCWQNFLLPGKPASLLRPLN